jgi:hypothetical protein
MTENVWAAAGAGNSKSASKLVIQRIIYLTWLLVGSAVDEMSRTARRAPSFDLRIELKRWSFDPAPRRPTDPASWATVASANAAHPAHGSPSHAPRGVGPSRHIPPPKATSVSARFMLGYGQPLQCL